MKLLFKQRVFSWFDSYDIYDENGNIFYTVKGQLSCGHYLKIFNSDGLEIAGVKEKVFSWRPILNRSIILILTVGMLKAILPNGTIRFLMSLICR